MTNTHKTGSSSGVPTSNSRTNILHCVGRPPATLKADGLFEPAAVRRLLDEHNAGHRDHTLPLWALLVFQYWRHRRA